MDVVGHWEAGEPCDGCGCQAVIDTPTGRLRAHLADCPRLDVNQLRNQLQGAVEALREVRQSVDNALLPDGRAREQIGRIVDAALHAAGGR